MASRMTAADRTDHPHRGSTIFLDRQLKIRRFTPNATRVYRLVATDIGRALADIRSDLPGDESLIDGVVLSFSDVTAQVDAIASRKARGLVEAIVDAMPLPLLVRAIEPGERGPAA